MWLWACLIISAFFLIFWFWFGPSLIKENKWKGLFVKFILVIGMSDCILTLISQPSYYWKNYSFWSENSFIGKILLGLHPLAFVFGIIFWLVIITFVMRKLNFFFSWVFFFALSFGHLLGAWSWIQNYLQSGIGLLSGKINYFWESLAEELFNYFSYILLGLIFALAIKFILKEINKQ